MNAIEIVVHHMKEFSEATQDKVIRAIVRGWTLELEEYLNQLTAGIEDVQQLSQIHSRMIGDSTSQAMCSAVEDVIAVEAKILSRMEDRYKKKEIPAAQTTVEVMAARGEFSEAGEIMAVCEGGSNDGDSIMIDSRMPVEARTCVSGEVYQLRLDRKLHFDADATAKMKLSRQQMEQSDKIT